MTVSAQNALLVLRPCSPSHARPFPSHACSSVSHVLYGCFQGEPGPPGDQGREGPLGPPGDQVRLWINLLDCMEVRGVAGRLCSRAQLMPQHLGAKSSRVPDQAAKPAQRGSDF